MAQLLGLSAEQVDGIRPLFPKEHGGKRVEDRKVLSGIISVIQKGLRWVDAPPADGLRKTLDNRCRCCSDKGIFDRIFSELSASDSAESPDAAELPDAPEPEVLMIDATDIKAHPTASSLNADNRPALIRCGHSPLPSSASLRDRDRSAWPPAIPCCPILQTPFP